MATKKLDVKEQATTTVDGLPQGAPISDADTLMVMQGDGSRKTVKVSAKAIKDYIPSAPPYALPVATKEILGGIKVGENLTITEDGVLSAQGQLPGKQFFIATGPLRDWTPPVDVKSTTLVVNTGGPVFFVALTKGDYAPGTEVDIIMYTGDSVASVVTKDPDVKLSAPYGNSIKRDEWAKLVYVGDNTWLLRGYALEYGIPYIEQVVAPDPSGFKPFEAQPIASIVAPDDYKVVYYAKLFGQFNVPVMRQVESGATRDRSIFTGLKGWTNYEFWATYLYPDGKESPEGNHIGYEVQGDTPKDPELKPVTGRGYLELMQVDTGAAKPEVAQLQISYQETVVDGKVVPVWKDCERDKYSPELWSYLASKQTVKDNDNILWRVAASNGVWTEYQVYRDFPFKKNIAPRETFVRSVKPGHPFSGFELRWRNKDKANDPNCKWLIKATYKANGKTVKTSTHEVDWNSIDGIYSFFTLIPEVSREGEVSLTFNVQAKTYDLLCEESTLEIKYDSGEPSGFRVDAITADYANKEVIVDFDGVDASVVNVCAILAKDSGMADPIILHDSNKKYTRKVWLSAKNLPNGTYFVQAAAFDGGTQVSNWMPEQPIKLVYGE